MSDPLIPVTRTPDPVADSIDFINKRLRDACTALASALDDSIKQVTDNDAHTAAEFWQRVGTKGVNTLQALALARSYLEGFAPDLVNERIAHAGSGVTPHQDGTVTVNP
jgi:hypothetical protein